MQLSSHRRCSLRKGVLKNFAQVFSCEFCKISKNTLFTEQVWTTASYNRVMGCSTKSASCCRFRKAVLNNFLLINFITTYAYWLKNFSFANFLLIEGYRKHYLRKGSVIAPFVERFKIAALRKANWWILLVLTTIQKQSFRGVWWKGCSYKCRRFRRKTYVPESLF